MTHVEKADDEAAVHTTIHKAANEAEIEQWLAIRKEAGQHIDPETAEVTWSYVNTFDPYDVLDLPEQQFGREYFARAHGSDIWVLFDDLPNQTCAALWKEHKSKLAFPAGLPGFQR